MHVRPAASTDYEEFTRLFAELGVPDPTPSRERFEDDMCKRMLIAHEGERVVGYAVSEVLEGVGYVRHVVSDPQHRRKGIGRALMAELARMFASRGARRWCLNVKPENTAAVKLYESFGLAIAYESDAMRVLFDDPHWPVDPGVELATTPAELDATLEQTFGLLPRQLSSARVRHFEIVAARRSDTWLAVAAFRRNLAGAFPFRVREVDFAPTVFELLRRQAHRDAPFFQVIVEGNPPLRDALLARGARSAMHFVHLQGALMTG